MAKIPVRFKRVAAAFDDMARARLCESSGSEHSPENSPTDLSDLVNSFIEKHHFYNEESEEGKIGKKSVENEWKKSEISSSESDSFLSDSETKDRLQSLFGYEDNDDVKRNIHDVAENACKLMGNSSSSSSPASPETPSSQAFRRLLMTRLRDRGFDAGICKSKWEKTGNTPAGNYEYIDVNVSGTRYIVEVFLAGQFEIARPTKRYTAFLDVFPQIFVGKLEELKQVVRLMCTALRESMKRSDMSVPPWRKNGYMQAKWFGSYKRTVNAVPAKKLSESDNNDVKRRFGFEASSGISYYCRDDFASKVGLKVGYLAAAFNSDAMQL